MMRSFKDLMEKYTYTVGGKIYARCATCGEIVRINKPIFGDLHICLSDEEIKD